MSVFVPARMALARGYYGLIRPPAYHLWCPSTAGSPRRGFVRFPWATLTSLGTWFHLGWAEPHPVREREAVLLGSRGIHLKACPGLGTPATPNLALSVIWMLPSARLTASTSRRQTISVLNPRGLLPCCLRFARRSAGQAQDSLPAYLLRL